MLRKMIRVDAVLIAVSIACCVCAAHAQLYVTDGLIGFWTLDAEDVKGDVAVDVSGNGNDGTIMGDPASTAGKVDEALDLDGDGDYVVLPDMGGAMQVSAEVWAWGRDNPQAHGLVSDTQWMDGTIHFKLRDGQISIRSPSQDSERLGPVVEPETWYHFAFTADADAGEMVVYMDGDVVLEEAYTDTNPIRLNEMKIGDEHVGRHFDGILDEVRIYDRVLTAEEVSHNLAVTSNAADATAVDPAGSLSVVWGHIKAAAHAATELE